MGLFVPHIIISSTIIDATPERIWDFFTIYRTIIKSGMTTMISGVGLKENLLKSAQKLILRKLSGGTKVE